VYTWLFWAVVHIATADAIAGISTSSSMRSDILSNARRLDDRSGP